jgi:hypothetical protein
LLLCADKLAETKRAEREKKEAHKAELQKKKEQKIEVRNQYSVRSLWGSRKGFRSGLEFGTIKAWGYAFLQEELKLKNTYKELRTQSHSKRAEREQRQVRIALVWCAHLWKVFNPWPRHSPDHRELRQVRTG